MSRLGVVAQCFALHQGRDDAVLVGLAQVRVHGQTHDLTRGCIGRRRWCGLLAATAAGEEFLPRNHTEGYGHFLLVLLSAGYQGQATFSCGAARAFHPRRIGPVWGASAVPCGSKGRKVRSPIARLTCPGIRRIHRPSVSAKTSSRRVAVSTRADQHRRASALACCTRLVTASTGGPNLSVSSCNRIAAASS